MTQLLKCEVCSHENPDDSYYCGRCGNEVAGRVDYDEDGSSIINAPLMGDRRQVTVIFADISGFTALNDAAKTSAEVENVVRLINQLLSELSKAIYEYDGYIDKYIGDEIMALFGAPTAHENDPELALRAALSMMERLNEFNENPPVPLPAPLGMHMGINTGMVVAGMVGTDRKRSYTVMGDVVNVAARLESASVRGQVFVNEDTYALTNRLFVFEEKDPIKVKGKPEPLKVYELISARDLSQTQRGLTGMEASLVGREYEIQMLVDAYHQLHEGTGNIVVVAGDAGLGKTRLVAEAKRQVSQSESAQENQGSRWLFGRGLAYRQSFANRLFVDILYSYLELPEDSDDTLVKLRLEAMGDELFGVRKAEIIPYLATLLGIKLDDDPDLPVNDPQILQQRIYLAMGEWVEVLASQKPLVLVFEDLHWADPSSVALIEYLFTLTVYNPILLICVSRPERVSNFWGVKTESAREYANNFIELTLWPLTDDESRRLIRELLEIEPMPKDLEALLLSRAEGNPLFLEEVLRSLIEEGTIAHTDGHWEITRSVIDIDIPNTLQGVLTARIDRLQEPVKRVLQIAAVIGRVFPQFVLAPMVNDPAVLEKALEQLELADLIDVHKREPEPEYIFKHVLTYETAYNSMLHQQRQLIHRQIADFMATRYWLLGEQFAPIVAEHYYKSEIWPRALRYLGRAAEAAIQSFANREAVTFYTRGLEVVDKLGGSVDPATVLGIYEGRARTLTRLGEPQDAVEDYHAMLARAKEIDDRPAQMRALNGIGGLHASHYNFGEASEFFQQALDVARSIGDEPGIAETLNQLGNFYYNVGQLKLSTESYQEARDLSIEMNSEVGRISAEDGLSRIMLEQGEIAASLARYQEEIIPVRRRLGYRGGLMNSLSMTLVAQVYMARYEDAEATAEELLEMHQRSGDLYRVPLVKYYQGLGQLYQGHLHEAGLSMLEGLKLAQEQGQKSLQALGMSWLGYYDMVIGMSGKGLDYAEQSVEISRELGSPLYEMKAQAMLGAIYRHLGRLDEAVDTLEAVYQKAYSMGFTPDGVMTLYQLTRAYIDRDEWDKAESNVAILLELAEASGMREFLARTLLLSSMVLSHKEQHSQAIDMLTQASDIAESIDGRLTQFLVQIHKARIYCQADNSAAAKDALVYAKKIQRKLVESFAADEEAQQAFLQGSYSVRLQEIEEMIA
jgi:class 3 adenylate cyclase